MIEQMPCRRRPLAQWRRDNEAKLIGLPTESAAHLLQKSYVITRDEIASIKAKRQSTVECDQCKKIFTSVISLKRHKTATGHK